MRVSHGVAPCPQESSQVPLLGGLLALDQLGDPLRELLIIDQRRFQDALVHTCQSVPTRNGDVGKRRAKSGLNEERSGFRSTLLADLHDRRIDLVWIRASQALLPIGRQARR